jgi:hypothetical protein
LHAAALPTNTMKQQTIILDTWENRTVSTLRNKTAGLLSDSQLAIETMVGRQMILPEYRSEPA